MKMLPKNRRLTGSDIQYMLRRGKKHYGEVFIISAIPQYPNNAYHQFSLQIPNKVDKRAVTRNMLKRHAVILLEEELAKVDMSYTKLFVFVNKKNIEKRRPPLETLKKTAIVNQRKALCKKDFTLIIRRLGTPHRSRK